MSEVPEKQGMSTTKKVVIAMGVLIVLCAIGASGEKNESVTKPAEPPPAAPTVTAPAPAPTVAAEAASTPSAPEPPPAPTEPAWVTARKDACAKYDEAPNEIQKSAVFTEYINAAKAKQGSVENVRASLSELETPQGGAHVMLTMSTPFGEFNNNDILVTDRADREVKKGSPLYNAVGELAEGASVNLSATNIVPSENPFSERLGVCGDTWIVKFTKIEAPK